MCRGLVQNIPFFFILIDGHVHERSKYFLDQGFEENLVLLLKLRCSYALKGSTKLIPKFKFDFKLTIP